MRILTGGTPQAAGKRSPVEGRVNAEAVIMAGFLVIKRAGAKVILIYFAKEAVRVPGGFCEGFAR